MSKGNHGIGRRFEGARLDQLDRKYFGDVLTYAKTYQSHLDSGRGLLLAGSPGSGKTYASVALMLFIQQKAPRFDFYVVAAPDLFDANLKETDSYRHMSWWRTLTSVKALVINDLGKEDRSREWRQEEVVAKLGRVLRARHEAQLPVFITTNLALKAQRTTIPTFEKVYGASLWSLIYDMTAYRAQINAPDRRKGEA